MNDLSIYLNRIKRFLIAGVIVIGLSGFTYSDKVIIHTQSGAHSFSIERADTPQKAERGLMFVTDLPADAGMLFMGQTPKNWIMWMKNTPLPLDMLFFNAQGEIVTIITDTTPYSLTHLSAGKAVLGVLEVNAGTVKRLDIQTGDKLEWPSLKNLLPFFKNSCISRTLYFGA